MGDNAIIFKTESKPENGALPTQICALKKQSGALPSNESYFGWNPKLKLFGERPLALAGRTEQKNR